MYVSVPHAEHVHQRFQHIGVLQLLTIERGSITSQGTWWTKEIDNAIRMSGNEEETYWAY